MRITITAKATMQKAARVPIETRSASASSGMAAASTAVTRPRSKVVCTGEPLLAFTFDMKRGIKPSRLMT
ncbi:hypothetical protein D3C78_1903220 [compost metagenome]